MMLLAILLACKREPEPVGPLAPEGTRHALARVEFNLWVDYIPMFGATDADCRWLDPAVSDESTPWPPLQAFWVIYEDARDVEVAELSDVYFEGDLVLPGDFEPLEGFEPLGFKYFSGFQAGLLDVEAIRRDPDGRGVEADFGNPVNATVRIEAEPDGEGCATATSYCEEGACDGGFEPLEAIEIDLGAFYLVQDVRFR
ncbi:MAG: hypothetical protein H6737_02100 [Alphaproteobacteria bacterium]|nr:hypothetical protein [Alphaproteobacteria bacterium]